MSLDLGELVDVMILTCSDGSVVYLPGDSEGEYLPVYSWINPQGTRGHGFAGMSPLPRDYSFTSHKMPRELVLSIIEAYLKKQGSDRLTSIGFYGEHLDYERNLERAMRIMFDPLLNSLQTTLTR